MGNITKKSHFVWQYYLRSWATEGSIFCSMNGSIPRKTSLDNVANKRYFYRLAPFNRFEKEFLIRAIDKNLPQYKQDVNEIINRYVDEIDALIKPISII